LYRAKYSSKYDTDFELNGTVDAVVNIQPKVQFFDADAITVWISEDTTSNYTASFLQAMTVPLNSTTNGSMVEYMREAQEVVFEYPTYLPTDNYNSTEVTSSIQGGSYKASTCSR